MPNGFDHAIVAVNDLGAAEANFRALGFTVTNRPDVGATETENRLVCFEDGSYIEIFSFRDKSKPSEHRWAPLLKAHGDGWVDYSVHVADAAAEHARLTAAGVAATTPRAGGRAIADGRRWGVAVVMAGRGVGSPVLPFLIQDTEARDVRVPDGPAAVQPHKATAIVGITLLTGGIGAVDSALAALYGPGTDVKPRIDGARAARRYDFAGRWIEVIEPAALPARGEGVLEVTVGRPGHAMPGDGTLFPDAATNGARLRIAT